MKKIADGREIADIQCCGCHGRNLGTNIEIVDDDFHELDFKKRLDYIKFLELVNKIAKEEIEPTDDFVFQCYGDKCQDETGIDVSFTDGSCIKELDGQDFTDLFRSIEDIRRVTAWSKHAIDLDVYRKRKPLPPDAVLYTTPTITTAICKKAIVAWAKTHLTAVAPCQIEGNWKRTSKRRCMGEYERMFKCNGTDVELFVYDDGSKVIRIEKAEPFQQIPPIIVYL